MASSSIPRKLRLWLVLAITVVGSIAVIAGISSQATKAAAIAMVGAEQ